MKKNSINTKNIEVLTATSVGDSTIDFLKGYKELEKKTNQIQ